MRRKQFDQKLFDENDVVAREILKKYLTKGDNTCIDNPNKYGPDLIFNGKIFMEVEIKHDKRWKQGKDFPFETVQLPFRKNDGEKGGGWESNKILFWILHPSGTEALVFSKGKLEKASLKEVSNKYSKSGEYFYQVPIDQCKKVDFTCQYNG